MLKRAPQLRRILLSAAILSGACGSSTPETSTSTPAPAESGSTRAAGGTADACALLTPAEIAAAVGNPVMTGRPNAGPEVCKWDTERPEQTSVLVMARLKGSDREKYLCEDVRKTAAEGKGLTGIGEAARWQFSRTAGLFNSGELEVCQARGYVSVSLDGERDEASLKAAAMSLAEKIFARM